MTRTTPCAPSCLRHVQLAILFAVFLTACVQSADGAKKRDRDVRPGRYPDVDRYEEVYVIFRNCFLFALAPCVFVFVRALLTDPAVPYVMRMLWLSFKKRITSNLSRTEGDSRSSGNSNRGARYQPMKMRAEEGYYRQEEGRYDTGEGSRRNWEGRPRNRNWARSQ